MEEKDDIVKQPEKTEQGSEDFFVAEEYLDSFSALKDSIMQGADLANKRSALEEYQDALDKLKKTHADRVDIAHNYESIVAEQRRLATSIRESIARINDSLSMVESRINDQNDELAQLKRSQENIRRPLQDELNRRASEVDAAKAALKEANAQRDSLYKFAESEERAAKIAAQEQIIEQVQQRLEAAKGAQRGSQKVLDTQEREDRRAIKAVQERIDRSKSECEQIKKEREEQEAKLNAANSRIEYCDYVIAHPNETEEMQKRIIENEATARDMQAQIDKLAETHSVSKKKSTKARNALIVAGVAIVVIIIIFFVVSNK